MSVDKGCAECTDWGDGNCVEGCFAETRVDLELRSQLYAYLGGATATASGHEWDHDRLRVFIDSLMELPAMHGLMAAKAATFRERYELQRRVEAVRRLADEMDREDPQISTYHIARRIRSALDGETA